MSVAGISSISMIQIRSSMTEMAVDNFQQIARELHFNTNNIIRDAEWTIKIISGDNHILSNDSRQELIRYNQVYNQFEDILVLDTSGNILSAANYLYSGNWRYMDVFRDAINGSLGMSDVHYISSPLRTVVTFAGPLYNETGIIGVIGVQLNMKKITDISNHVQIGKTGFAFIVDENDRIIAHPDDFRLMSLAENLEFTDGKAYYAEEGKEYFGSYYSGSSWTTVVVQESNELYKPMFSLIIKTGIVVLIVFVLSTIALVMMSGSIVRPIIRLTKATERIAGGDMDVELDVKSKDEIGSLARSYMVMTQQLKASRKKLERYSLDLEKQVAQRTRSLEKKETQLKNANRRLRALDKQKDSFISIAAHELKTPLTSIKGFAQLLMEKQMWKDKGKVSNYLKLINQNTDKLYGLVCDLVDSSRISLGKISMNIDTVKTRKLIKDIRQNMEVIMHEKGIKPEFSIENGVSEIRADYDRLMQVLRNLLINAIHFTESGGKISLRVYDAGKYARFEVEDDGQGIPKEQQARIFSKFYQVDSSMRRKVGGSGLGLSVAKGMVELMKGKIWFESSPGKGTTFYFTIPKVIR